MRGWISARCSRRAALLAVLLGAGADPAFADLTVFIGSTTTLSRTTRGAALGLSLESVGAELELARTPAARVAGRPGLTTGLFNLVLGTPFRSDGRFQVYGAVGAGVYREDTAERGRADLALAGGGGVYIRLAGPLRIRLDYRMIALRRNTLPSRPHRAYAGLNVAF